MKLVLKDPVKMDLFVQLFKQLPQVCDSMNIQFSPDHMYIQSMDSHHVCMVEIRLEDSWFDEYEVDEEDTNTISVNTTILQLILKCKSSEQHMTFTYEDDPDKMFISFNEGKKEDYDKDFEMPLISLEQDVLHIPSDSEWQSEFEIKSSVFQTLMNEMNQFSDTTQLLCSEDEFTISGHGENGRYKINFNIDDLESYSIDEDTVVSTSYSVPYFAMISSFSKLSSMLHVEASNELPIKMTYNLGDEDNYVKFFLAPKIVDEDD